MKRSFGLSRLLERAILETLLTVDLTDMGALVRRIGVSRSTIRLALHALERRHLVRRSKAPGRGGAELWSITSRGTARAEADVLFGRGLN